MLKEPGNTRYCTKCEQVLLIKDFYIKSDGRSYSYCRSCWNNIRIDCFGKLKHEAIEYLGGNCQECGYNTCDAALEFHHRNPIQKDFSISNYKGTKLDKIKTELDKCILLCANCHRQTHFNLHLK